MDSQKIKVSVVIPTYNLAGHIGQAVDSVLSQTYSDYEIIVVDDGSTDRSREVLAPYIRSKRIKYVFQKNQGVSCARNTGIKASSGRLIAFLDADDMWTLNKLEKQVAALKMHPEVGMIHSDIRKTFNDKSISLPCRHGLSEERIKMHSGDIFDDFLARNIYISCQTVVVRRECFDRVGLFDEKLTRIGFEDFEMWLRILKHYKAHYIHEALAFYRVRDNSLSKDRPNMRKAHEYVIGKITDKFGVSQELKDKAFKAMMKEWGIGKYSLLNPVHESLEKCKAKLLGRTVWACS